jgi:hypothetical protein
LDSLLLLCVPLFQLLRLLLMLLFHLLLSMMEPSRLLVPLHPPVFLPAAMNAAERECRGETWS